MKSLRMLITIIAAISVVAFFASLAVVVSTNGADETAANFCAYSLISSFVSLVFYEPGKKRKWA
jgi:hypothetical protein